MSAQAPARPLTHARVLRIAVPVVLSNATVPLIGLVDTGVVGQLGAAEPIAAVALGAVILTSIYWIFGFLRMGTTGLVGQADGAGEQAEVSSILTRACVIAALAGAAIIALQPAIVWAAFSWQPTTPETEALARAYIAIRIWSAPFLIATYAFTGWLIAMERARAVFWVQLLMNGVNAALDLWFVLGLGWGVSGVAVATVIAEICGAGLGLWFCRDAFARRAWRDWPRVFDRARMIRMAVLNVDILLRSVLLLAIFTSFTLLSSARFDPVVLAANHVLMQFLHVTAHAMDGFAFSAEALVARAIGRKSRARLRRSIYLTGVWGFAVCAGLAVVFAFAGGAVVDVLAKAPEVRIAAREFLPWMVIAPLLGWASWMLDGIFIGATRGADMRNMMVVSAAIYAVAAALLLPAFGNHGLWAALCISFVARGVTLAARYPALERDSVPS